MTKLPSFQFYPGDWLKDPALRRCSAAARGVWMDVLCLMFESDERGKLVTNGVTWALQELAQAISGDTSVNLACLNELLRTGVMKQDEGGCFYSKRLIQDELVRNQTKERVRKLRSRNGVVTHSVTPPYEDEDEDEVKKKEVPVNFKLEQFDGGEEFEILCRFYSKAERSGLARQRYFEALEWCVENKQVSRKEAAKYILGRAKLYCSKCKFQKGMTKWLEEKIFEQPESAWSDIVAKSVVSLKNPADEMRRQLEAD